jgi:hypothetical protein
MCVAEIRSLQNCLKSADSNVSATTNRQRHIGTNIDFSNSSWIYFNTELLKKKYKRSKIYFTKITDAKSMSCVRMERKFLKILIWISHHVPGVHTIFLSAKGSCVQNGGKRTGKSLLRAGIRHDVSVKCATIFSDTLWKESTNQKVYITGTSVGRAGLSIWHMPCYTWGSHWVLVRCENNFESSPFSLYIARRHKFNSILKINFWKCILLFE